MGGNFSVSITNQFDAGVSKPEEQTPIDDGKPRLHPAIVYTGNPAVDRLVNAMKASDPDRELHAVLDANFRFKHPAVEMDRESFITATVKGLLASFPDLHYNFVAVKDNRLLGKIECVSYFTGSHCGKPFGRPGMHKVAATGEFVKTGQEPWVATYEGDVIKEIQILADLPSCGPGGMYNFIANEHPQPVSSIDMVPIDRLMHRIHIGSEHALEKCFSEDFRFNHPDIGTMNRREYANLFVNVLRKSFPDLLLNIIKLESSTEDKNLCRMVTFLSGHHNGEPFGTSDGNLIQPTGVYAESEQEECVVRYNDNVITEIRVEHPIPSGGPQGLFIAIGGRVPTPQAVEDLNKFESGWKSLMTTAKAIRALKQVEESGPVNPDSSYSADGGDNKEN